MLRKLMVNRTVMPWILLLRDRVKAARIGWFRLRRNCCIAAGHSSSDPYNSTYLARNSPCGRLAGGSLT